MFKVLASYAGQVTRYLAVRGLRRGRGGEKVLLCV
jgi:hypothetical protein